MKSEEEKGNDTTAIQGAQNSEEPCNKTGVPRVLLAFNWEVELGLML